MRSRNHLTILGVRMDVAALTVYWMFIFVGTHLPATIDASPAWNDKVKHFSAFFLLGLLMSCVFTSGGRRSRLWLVLVIGMAYAAVDEITQRFVPGRMPDVFDFAADSAGLIAATLLYASISSFWQRDRSEPPKRT